MQRTRNFLARLVRKHPRTRRTPSTTEGFFRTSGDIARWVDPTLSGHLRAGQQDIIIPQQRATISPKARARMDLLAGHPGRDRRAVAIVESVPDPAHRRAGRLRGDRGRGRAAGKPSVADLGDYLRRLRPGGVQDPRGGGGARGAAQELDTGKVLKLPSCAPRINAAGGALIV